MTIWVYTEGRPSDGAQLLAGEPGFCRLFGSIKKVKPGEFIVNWGSTTNGNSPFRLNHSNAVSIAVNKLKTFQHLKDAGISTVPWTTDRQVAHKWLVQGHKVMARKTLTGHEGDGIIVIEKVDELVEAPLYTMYIKSAKEFRVHATPFGVIDTQWKVRDPNREVVDWKVRSYKNGFLFQRKNIKSSWARDELAMNAVKALGLDFAGLDIIEDINGAFYVLEANTAPGIEGSTVKFYAEAIRDLIRTRLNPHQPAPVIKQPVFVAEPLPPVHKQPAGIAVGDKPEVAAKVNEWNLNALWNC